MSGIAKIFLSQTHLKAIGLVAAEWSYTEAWLEFVIWDLAGIDMERGHAITTHLQSETRIQMLEALADKQLRDDGLKEKLRQLLARLRTLRTERNDIVHALWVSNRKSPLTLSDALKKRKPTPAWVKVKARGKVDVSKKLMTSKQIMDCADRIGKLVMDMYDVMSDFEKHRKQEALVQALLARPTPDQSHGPTTT